MRSGRGCGASACCCVSPHAMFLSLIQAIASVGPGSSRSRSVDTPAGSTKAAPPVYGGGTGSSQCCNN
eukprot:7335231-Karenia_brevis.AAC.1